MGVKRRSLNFIIPTIGIRGNVQSYIALALGLQKAGHAVILATHPYMRGLVESYGMDFAPVGPDTDISHEAAPIRARSPHWMLGFMCVMRFTFAMLEQSTPTCSNCARPPSWALSSAPNQMG
jgi:hypothetical protein